MRWAIRLAASWAVNAAAILLLAWIVPGFHVSGPGSALALAGVIAVLGATLRPLLVYAALKLIILTAGLLSLVISAVVVLIGATLVEGVDHTSFWSALLVVVGLGLVNTAAWALLPFDDDRWYFRGVARRSGARGGARDPHASSGLVLFEIDGLAEPVLRRALEAGLVPTMASWLERGSHVLTPWECDLSSQTGASQAGLLHGDNDEMPAFRWLEKETGRVMVSNHPEDAAEIERRRVGGGLLAAGGSAVGNMFSGAAEQSLLTISRIPDNYRSRIPSFYAYFSDPQHYVRALVLILHDIWLEKLAARRQRRRDERPRVSRRGLYPIVRAATTVALRELGVFLMISEMYRGVPAMYATFVGYDEVAHHSGPERPDTLQVLRRLDKQIARLERASRWAPRPYRIVVLSDHGQSPGTPFRQRAGETLHELVGRLTGGRHPAPGAGASDEGLEAVNVALTETIADGHRAGARIARRTLGTRVSDDRVDIARVARALPPPAAEPEAPVVLASGCLGLVYLPDVDGRASLEQISARWPGLVEELAIHPWVSFLMVRAGDEGALVLGADGRRRLADDVVEGADPLAGFGLNAADHLRRTDGFERCPDVLLNGRFDPVSGDVTAFEEFTGSHGGLGGDQTRAFLLHPAELDVGQDPLVGAVAVHRLLLDWRERLHGPVDGRAG